MYKLSPEDNSVIKDGIHAIPFAPDNIDYQEYLEWVAEGNTPEAADE
jgi:hypothetical protein|tara:strand:- start:344 stop:484 length:141 start_codon:yes stop_codon:yes gene_type:complete